MLLKDEGSTVGYYARSLGVWAGHRTSDEHNDAWVQYAPLSHVSAVSSGHESRDETCHTYSAVVTPQTLRQISEHTPFGAT